MNIQNEDDNSKQLVVDFGKRTVNDFAHYFQSKQINLEPGFQRHSVWSSVDRRRLIHSMVSGYPLPNIFLYKRYSRGKLIYDVIDGKQRLETIFMFLGLGRFKHHQFAARLDLGEEQGADWYSWQDIRKYFPDFRGPLESYQIQTVEVSGKLSEIILLFVRINSTGKRLTSGEKRHARFFTSRFLKEAERLVGRFQKYFLQNGILSPTQLDRMKGTELVSELLMSIHQGGIINKKTALDRAIGNDSVNGNTLSRVSREFVSTLNELRRLFPELHQTRFRRTVDYYSLFMIVWEMRKQEFVLADRRLNKVASRMLRKLSNGVDELRVQLKKAKVPKGTPQIYSDYLLTVQGDTDSSANRQRRREILAGLLFSLFDYKDDKRMFSPEQRRVIWNSDDKRNCANPKCRRPLKWDDFTIDHIVAWIKGGRTTLKNAQLMCRRCNSRKGGK